MSRKKKIAPIYKYNKIFLFLFVIATVSMGIGYASVNSVVLELSGKAAAKEIDGVYIIETEYKC